jgi:hypothetical protein
MGWYANAKARRAAAKAGLPKARAIAEDKHDAVKVARKAKKRERKLARRGTAGPS